MNFTLSIFGSIQKMDSYFFHIRMYIRTYFNIGKYQYRYSDTVTSIVKYLHTYVHIQFLLLLHGYQKFKKCQQKIRSTIKNSIERMHCKGSTMKDFIKNVHQRKFLIFFTRILLLRTNV